METKMAMSLKMYDRSRKFIDYRIPTTTASDREEAFRNVYVATSRIFN